MIIDQLEDVVQKLCNDSGFDKEMALYVLETYIKQSTDIITTALQKLNQMEGDAYLNIESLMHKLKGSSGNVRAMKIMELAIEAENLAKDQNFVVLKHKLNEILIFINNYNSQLFEGV